MPQKHAKLKKTTNELYNCPPGLDVKQLSSQKLCRFAGTFKVSHPPAGLNGEVFY